MNNRILAFDFDGTIAEDGQVPAELIEMFQEAHSQAHPLFLVTGRLFRQADIEGILPYLTGIVWENGAVLEHLPTERVSLPFGTLPDLFLKDLEQTGIQMLTGMAMAATWAQNEATVMEISGQHRYAPTLDWNKLALLILPTGANKATGLKRLLEQCNLSSETLTAFGDGENDQSLLAIADTAVAVQDAVPSLQEIAHVVSNNPGPSGVIEILQDLLGEARME